MREATQRLLVGEQVGGGVVAAGLDPLPDQRGEPARFGEQLVMFAKDAARRAEDGKLFLQPLGRVERAAGVPEGRVGALGRLVVKDEEIADIDIFAQRLAIARKSTRLNSSH